MTTIQQVARQAARQAIEHDTDLKPAEWWVVADAVAVAVLREKQRQLRRDVRCPEVVTVLYFDQELAAFTPAEPPQQAALNNGPHGHGACTCPACCPEKWAMNRASR